MSKMTTKTPATVPVFAAVMSPDLSWSEYETRTLRGSTHLPKGKGSAEAFVEVPTLDLDLPDARAVRVHEMLHVAFTPDIQPVAARLIKEGLSSGVVLQIAEDMRLTHIAERNRLQSEDVYYSQDTVLGLVNQLMDSAQAAETAPGGAQSLAVAIVAVLGSMYGQPLQPMMNEYFGPMHSLRIDDNIERLRATAQAAYGTLGYEAIERVLDSNDNATAAAAMLYAHAGDVYGKSPPAGENKKERIAREQAAFESVYRYAHEVLESLLYSEPPPVSPTPAARDESDLPWCGEPKDALPKAEPVKSPKAPKLSKEAVVNKKMASEGIDRVDLMMGKPVSAAAADHLRRRGKAEAEAKAKAAAEPDPDLPVFSGTSALIPDDLSEDAGLSAIDNLDLNMDITGSVNWAPMDIVAPPLERSFKVRVPRRGRPSLDGEIPRHWSRWFADRAILDNRGRRPGGTLLVDVSGSMAWTHERTLGLINATPAMTIALYSSGDVVELSANGKPYHTGGGFRGRLTVIARQGKAVAADYNWRDLHGHANACDGPALAWLARQPAPRVWFSDGNVTVMASCKTKETAAALMEAFEDAIRIVKLGNITRTTSQEDVARIFSGLSPVSQQTSKDCGCQFVSSSARSVFTRIAAKRWGV